MTTLTLEIEPIANQVTVPDEKLILDLADGVVKASDRLNFD